MCTGTEINKVKRNSICDKRAVNRSLEDLGPLPGLALMVRPWASPCLPLGLSFPLWGNKGELHSLQFLWSHTIKCNSISFWTCGSQSNTNVRSFLTLMHESKSSNIELKYSFLNIKQRISVSHHCTGAQRAASSQTSVLALLSRSHFSRCEMLGGLRSLKGDTCEGGPCKQRCRPGVQWLAVTTSRRAVLMQLSHTRPTNYP